MPQAIPIRIDAQPLSPASMVCDRPVSPAAFVASSKTTKPQFTNSLPGMGRSPESSYLKCFPSESARLDVPCAYATRDTLTAPGPTPDQMNSKAASTGPPRVESIPAGATLAPRSRRQSRRLKAHRSLPTASPSIRCSSFLADRARSRAFTVACSHRPPSIALPPAALPQCRHVA